MGQHRTQKQPFSRLSDGQRHPVTVTRKDERVAVVIDLDSRRPGSLSPMPTPVAESPEPSPWGREAGIAYRSHEGGHGDSA